MKIIQSLENISKWVKQQHKLGKTVGMITGCFDVVHYGHVQLFRFSKKKVDNLLIVIESDETIKLSKGFNRPIFNSKIRAKMLSGFEDIDRIFIKKDKCLYGSKEMDRSQQILLKKIKPNFLITDKTTDKYWEIKKKRCVIWGIKLILFKQKSIGSTTVILEKIRSEI